MLTLRACGRRPGLRSAPRGGVASGPPAELVEATAVIPARSSSVLILLVEDDFLESEPIARESCEAFPDARVTVIRTESVFRDCLPAMASRPPDIVSWMYRPSTRFCSTTNPRRRSGLPSLRFIVRKGPRIERLLSQIRQVMGHPSSGRGLYLSSGVLDAVTWASLHCSQVIGWP